MEIKKLTWDTQFFNKEIGELFLEKAVGFLDIMTQNFELIVVKQLQDFEVGINGFEETFKETKVIFLKENLTINDNDFFEIKDTDSEEKDLDFFKYLAYESGKHSRFLLDKKFGEIKFKKFYDEWVINSNNKKKTKKTFYIEEENKAIGFVTLQQKENEGKIGLIAINPAFQGKGFGKKLLQFTGNYCVKNDITSLEIPTQKENRQACNFYEKMGYKIKKQELIKHFWKV